ncbi:MAG: 2-dehydro-3-deoxygalactonokinase [Pseudomonadota bacterium]
MSDVNDIDWIAVDWGTTHLRAWAMGQDGRVLGKASSDAGMNTLDPSEFEPTLASLIAPWRRTGIRVLACGMVGARQGWQEAPYVAVPTRPSEVKPARITATHDMDQKVWIVPGLSQSNPPDVMRGEETQIAGFLAEEPDFEGILCLPGTHTKWVHLSAKEVVSFRTFMTGETFDLLSNNSVLRHSVAAPRLDTTAFVEAVSDTLSRPEQLAAKLFSIRAEATLTGTDPAVSRARLSGYLIGAELAAARPYWLGQEVVIAGEGALTSLYGQALEAQGAMVRMIDADPLTLRGLSHLRTTIRDHSLT